MKTGDLVINTRTRQCFLLLTEASSAEIPTYNGSLIVWELNPDGTVSKMPYAVPSKWAKEWILVPC